MSIPADLKYADTHEWLHLNDDGSVTVGITEHAQEQLGDLVFVEFPEVDAEISAGDAIGVIESVKAASDIYAPLSGKILDTNNALSDEPELVNSSPYDKGWLFKFMPEDATALDDLFDNEGYENFIATDE
jgi:glycine cleavage system H protein